MVVPHDYLTFLLQCLPAIDIDLARIRLHVHILLSLAICGKWSISQLISSNISMFDFRIEYFNNSTECSLFCLFERSIERFSWIEYCSNWWDDSNKNQWKFSWTSSNSTNGWTIFSTLYSRYSYADSTSLFSTDRYN